MVGALVPSPSGKLRSPQVQTQSPRPRHYMPYLPDAKGGQGSTGDAGDVCDLTAAADPHEDLSEDLFGEGLVPDF